METFVLDIETIDFDEYSITLAEKLFDRMKQALDDIAHISKHMCKQDDRSIRTLKVRRGYYRYDYGWRGTSYKEVPEMQLRGFWLEKAGFTRGESVQVITIKDMMILVPVRVPDNPE